jgi:hypothetical protein
MNKFSRLVLAGGLACARCAAPASAHRGRRLPLLPRWRCALRQIARNPAGSLLRWQHADASEPIDFKPENVAQIDFAPRPPAGGRADYSCKLWLANGDALAGNLVACDRDALTLDTWYAGKLKIPRRALQTLAFNPRTPILFDGLTGLDGWTQGNAVKGIIGESGQWSYRNGAFYADKAASIARDTKLPDRAQIQFDMAWRGPLNLAIALYTDSLQPILLTDKENGPDFGAFTACALPTPLRHADAHSEKGPAANAGRAADHSVPHAERIACMSICA